MDDRANVDVNGNTMNGGRYTKLWQLITGLVHFVIFLYCAFILYLCLSNEVVLFTWHPLLLAVGWILLMSEGILVFNNHNALIKYFGLFHKGKVMVHWIIQSVAITASIVGYIIVYVNKDLNNKPHLHSWHGISGFTSIISCIPIIVSGVCALYSYNMRICISPVNNKLIHRVFGIFTYSVGFLTILLSLFTHWFQRQVHSSVIISLFVLFSFVAFWCLLPPTRKVFNRLKAAL